MCLSNFHNRFGSMQIFLNFGVYYKDSSNSKMQQVDEEHKTELNNTLTTIDVRFYFI